MTNSEEVERADIEARVALCQNSLLGLGLGELVLKKDRIFVGDPNVIRPEEEIPPKSRENYAQYLAIIRELNRREQKYLSYKSPTVY